jgi:hypothetical protein
LKTLGAPTSFVAYKLENYDKQYGIKTIIAL